MKKNLFIQNLCLFCFLMMTSISLSAQFVGGAVALNESRVIHRSWHITNMRGTNFILRQDGNTLLATENSISFASTFVIEPGISDANFLTADGRWFHIRNLNSGQYITVDPSGELPRAVGLTEFDENSYAQQFRLIATGIASQYKLRSRLSSIGVDLVLETNGSGYLQADSPKLDPSAEQKFTFNLAMPTGANRRFILCSPGGRFMSDNGIKAEGTQVVQNKDIDESGIWELQHLGDANYLIHNTLTRMYLTAPSGSTAGDIPVMTSAPQGSRSEWQLDQTDAFFQLRSKEFQNLFISATDAQSGQLVRLRTSGDSFRRWLISEVVGEIESLPGNFEKIETGEISEDCFNGYGTEFKKALCERIALNPAQSELYFDFIRAAIAAKMGANRVDEILQKIELDNTGHRIDLSLAIRYYITEVLPYVPSNQWSPASQAAVTEISAKIAAIRADYSARLQSDWNDYVQYHGSNISLADLYFFWIDGDGFEWPEYFEATNSEAYQIADYVSGAATFQEFNNALIGGVAIGATIATFSVLYTQIPPALMSFLFVFKAPPALAGIAGATSAGAYAAMISGPVLAVAVVAATFIAVQATDAVEFQQFVNNINDEIYWAQLPINLQSDLSSNNLLTRLKILTDLDFILGAPVSGSFQYNNNDNSYSPPFTLNCPAEVNLNLDNSGEATLTAQQAIGLILPICGGDISYNFSKEYFVCSDFPGSEVTLIAENEKSIQSCTFIVNVIDDIPATITCPGDQTLILDSNCSAIMPDFTGLASNLSDNCGITYVTQSYEAGYPISGAGDTSITLRVFTESNTSSTCTFILHKMDQVPPFLLCPLPYTLELGTDCSASLPDFSTLTTFFDICGEAYFAQFPSAGTSVEGTGSLTMTLNVTDEGGVSNSCEFTINKVDNMEPVVNCPLNQVLEMGDNCSATLPDYRTLAIITENCENFSLSQSTMPGTIVSGTGNLTVTLTVTDASSNSDQCSFIVSRVDNILPVITCPSTQTVILNENCEATLTDYGVFTPSADNCGVSSVTQTPVPGTSISGAGNMTITLRATDMSGNTGECTMSLIKSDNTAPSIVCFPQTINFNGESNFALESEQLVDVSDNCGILSIALSMNQITCAHAGQLVPVTATVTDLSGNTSSCISEITVNGLPCGWTQNQNGINCTNGSEVIYNAATNTWTVNSSNCYYTNPFTNDAMGFAQRTLCGNGSIVARVSSITGSQGWAGVMMRENTSAGSKKAQLTTNMGSFHRREFRTITGGAASPQQVAASNRFWLKIERIGNQFSMYSSQNGQSWHFLGAQTIEMGSCVVMGLLASNYSINSTVNAIFGNVSFTGSGYQNMSEPNTGIESGEIPGEFNVYPNPTSGIIHLNPESYLGLAVEIELYNLHGQLLHASHVDFLTEDEWLDLSQYSNGLYMVRLKSRGLPDAVRRIVLNK